MAGVQNQKALMILKHTIEIQKKHLLSHFHVRHEITKGTIYSVAVNIYDDLKKKKVSERKVKTQQARKPSFLTVHPDLQWSLKFYRQNPITSYSMSSSAFISHSCVNTDLKGGSIRHDLGFILFFLLNQT